MGATDRVVVRTVRQAPAKWCKGMERESRKLALEEAKGAIGAAF